MKDLIAQALPMFLAAFAVAFFTAYVARKSNEATDDGRLAYGPEVKMLGWISMAAAVASIVAPVISGHNEEYLAIIGLVALFGLLGGYILIESYWTKGEYDEQQISCSYPWRRRRAAKWADLETAAFKTLGQYYQLVFTDGTKIEFSKMIRGHKAVCDHVESLGVVVKDRPGRKV